MIENDTIKLLRECDAGVKMGVSSIKEVLEYVKAPALHEHLVDCKLAHDKLEKEIEEHLDRFRDEGKEPSMIAKGMSWMKTNVKLGMDDSDKTVADLMTDGCNMGVKSLSRYLNQFAAADERAKSLAGRLIELEEGLCRDMRGYL